MHLLAWRSLTAIRSANWRDHNYTDANDEASKFQQCIFARLTRQAMTFTTLCGATCYAFGLIEMIIVMF
ncbi:hypothetical protein UB31_33615 [Bradyrhizobium sp. LTSP849]|nr:hypothetical protein UB31_33615 [Bradyrhizobium sp. LTSP849]KJC48044.1 hypothetical protein UP06_11220 [Bradyrhizobium sp. LTSP857]